MIMSFRLRLAAVRTPGFAAPRSGNFEPNKRPPQQDRAKLLYPFRSINHLCRKHARTSVRLAAERAELKFLRCAPWRGVLMPPAVNQFKALPQRCRQTVGVVTADDKAAASFRTVGREGPDNGMPAQTQGAAEPDNIGSLIGRVGEKMEGRPVVPDIVALRRLPGGDVGCDPRHPTGLVAHANARGSERRGR